MPRLEHMFTFIAMGLIVGRYMIYNEGMCGKGSMRLGYWGKDCDLGAIFQIILT